MHIQFNFVQQCIQISTRINSINVHTYICVCFIQNQYNMSNIQQKSSQISNLQMELKYLDSLKFYYILAYLGAPPWGRVGLVNIGGGECRGVWGCPMHACMCMHTHTCMTS